MGCLSCINKYILYLLNLLLFLIGLGVVVVVSVALYKANEFDQFLASGTFTLPIIVLIVGIFLLLLGFFGCCGAKKENSCMLYTYSSVLLVLVIAQVICGIMLMVHKDKVEDLIKDGMLEAFDKYDNPKDTHFTEVLDNIQNDLKCCGVHGPDDWKNATYLANNSVADGCCKTMIKDCGIDYFDHANKVDIYQDGCFQAIKEDLQNIELGMSGLILVAAAVQLIIVILACTLAKKSSSYDPLV